MNDDVAVESTADDLLSRAALLHVHIPKSGGTTLNRCIYTALWRDEPKTGDPLFSYGIYHYPFGFFRPTDGIPLAARQALGTPALRGSIGHFSYGIHAYVDRPAIYSTMLREPVERVTSLIDHIRRYDKPGFKPSHPEYHDALILEGMDLARFLETFQIVEFDNDQTRRIAGEDPPFGHCSRALLDRARDNLARFAFVGTTERFDESLVLLVRLLGSRWEPSYFRRHVSENRTNRSWLTAEDVEVIRHHNELDSRLHAFAEELLEQRVADFGATLPDEVTALRRRNAAI